jgi:hypothetical protein
MKLKITYVTLLMAVSFSQLWAQDEVLLGQYHFNDATDYWEVGEGGAIQMNDYLSQSKWIVTINESGSGVFKALNGDPLTNTSLNYYPLAVAIEPQSGYAVEITRIEISHRTVLGGSNPVQRFAYNINTSDDVANSSTLNPSYDLEEGVIEGFIGIGYTFDNPLIITDSKLYFYNRIKALKTDTTTTEMDFIKFYGTFLDPSAPVINVPPVIQSAKAAPVGESSSNVIGITHSNLTGAIIASSSNPNFSAAFDDVDDETYEELRVTFTPEAEGYDTTSITLSSGDYETSFDVLGWGLPENAIAAWNFEEKSDVPDYYANTEEIPVLETYGDNSFEYITSGSWMYEIDSLYTTDGGTEVPEINGLKISKLGHSGVIDFRFDTQMRQGSPNTMKAGSYDMTTSTWQSEVYWNNTRTTLGIEKNVNLNFEIVDGEFCVVSAFDQSLDPPAFQSINPSVDFNNNSGWAFDNIIVILEESNHNIERGNSGEARIFAYRGVLEVRNNSKSARMDIINLHGAIIKSLQIHGDTQIPVEEHGIFIVRLIGEKETVIKKVFLH